ncbi:Acyl carrier protein, mitochondrial, partial [Zancudomyces culisetae]
LSKPKTSRLPTTSYTNFNLSNVRLYSGGGALTRDDIRDRIFAVLKDFDKVKQENISETAEFTKDLGLDSLDTVEVVMAIEEEFSVEIPDDDADAINTVQKAIDYIVSCEGAC